MKIQVTQEVFAQFQKNQKILRQEKSSAVEKTGRPRKAKKDKKKRRKMTQLTKRDNRRR